MPRQLGLAALLLCALGLPASAQLTFTRSMLPTRTSLEMLGLEQHWMAVAPLGVGTERIQRMSLAVVRGEPSGTLFIQTNEGNLNAYDSETGRFHWSTDLGHGTALSFPVSINSDRVFATNDNHLFCLDRGTGRLIWSRDLDKSASSATACDEERVVVGVDGGKIVAYSARDHSDEKGGRSAGSFLWAWQTNGKVTGHPIPAQKVIAFGSHDGRVYVALMNRELGRPARLLYRFLTGGPVSSTMGTLDSRTLLVPSEDNNVYAVDLFDGTTRWVHSMGSPVMQEPLVSRGDVFVLSSEGQLASLDPKSGAARWEVDAGKATLLTVTPTRLYLTAKTGDLVIGDRATGRVLAMPVDTTQRAGLRLGAYDHHLTNRLNDRIYLATSSGLIVCIRELGKGQPTWSRDPAEPPFGFLPQGEEPSASLTAPASGPGAIRAGSDAFDALGELPTELKR